MWATAQIAEDDAQPVQPPAPGASEREDHYSVPSYFQAEAGSPLGLRSTRHTGHRKVVGWGREAGLQRGTGKVGDTEAVSEQTRWGRLDSRRRRFNKASACRVKSLAFVFRAGAGDQARVRETG